jgi:hypothetical protein
MAKMPSAVIGLIDLLGSLAVPQYVADWAGRIATLLADRDTRITFPYQDVSYLPRGRPVWVLAKDLVHSGPQARAIACRRRWEFGSGVRRLTLSRRTAFRVHLNGEHGLNGLVHFGNALNQVGAFSAEQVNGIK